MTNEHAGDRDEGGDGPEKGGDDRHEVDSRRANGRPVESEAAYGRALEDHYGRSAPSEAIDAACRRAGLDPDALTRADLASFDEFHVGGRRATRRLAEDAALEPGTRVLDVGCGVGGPARTLAAEFDCDVVGVDAVAAYCRTAARLAARVGLADRTEFVRGNALALPVGGATVGTVWIQHATMNLPKTATCLAEARRVLRPDGTLAIHEVCAGPGGDPRVPVPWADDRTLSFLETPAELRETIESAGFAARSWTDESRETLAWFRGVREAKADRDSDPDEPALGLEVVLGEAASTKVGNVVRNLDEDRIRVIRGTFDPV